MFSKQLQEIKRTKLSNYKNIFLGGGAYPQTPHTAHLAMPWAPSRFATYKFSNLKNKFMPPPLPNPGYAPGKL